MTAEELRKLADEIERLTARVAELGGHGVGICNGGY